MQDLKRARVFVVHGLATRSRLAEDAVRCLGLTVFLQFLSGVGSMRIQDRMEMFCAEASPLIRSLIRSRTMKLQPGELSERVITLASEVWNTKPRNS
jgi:hypothetical protein